MWAAAAVLLTQLPLPADALNPGNHTLGTFSWATTEFVFAFGDSEQHFGTGFGLGCRVGGRGPGISSTLATTGRSTCRG